jgi:uncharacterized protein (TIRG00374 family)
LLFFLFSQSDIGRILELAAFLNIFIFVICLFLMLVIQVIAAYRWHVFVKADNPQTPVSKLFSFYLVGLFFNNFLPTTVGGDLVRGYDLYKYSGHGKAAVVSVFMERLTGLTAQVVVALVAVLIGYSFLGQPLILWLVCGISVAYLLFLIVLLNERMIRAFLALSAKLRLTQALHFLSETYQLFIRYHSNRRAMVEAIFLSLLIVMISIFTFYFLSLALHLSIPFGYFIIFLPIMNIIAMLPITLGGLGAREGIGMFLFSRVGVAPSDAFGLSLAWSLLLILISLLGGVLFALRRTRDLRLPSRDEIMEMKR